MDDAQLNFCIGVNAVYRFREPCQIIYTGNQNIVYATILQIGQYRQPEVSAFTFRQIQTQYLFFTFQIQGENGVDRFALIAPVFTDFIVDSIQPDKGIDRFQRTLLTQFSSGITLSVTALIVALER